MTVQQPNREAIESARRRHERGSALVIAMLVILALTGLGLLGLRNSTSELRSSANYRFSKQGLYVGQASMMYTINQVGANGKLYATYFDRLRDRAEGIATEELIYTLSPADVTTQEMLFSPTQDIATCTSDWKTTDNCQGLEANAGYLGTPGAMPNFRVEMLEPIDGPRAPGFGQNFCFKKFTFDSVAWVGGLPPASPSFRDPPQLVMTRSRAQALIGPVDCSGGYYGTGT